MKKIAFLGLGTMGFHMAGYLTNQSEYQVHTYNRSLKKADAWREKHPQASATDNLKTAVENAQYIFMCLGRDEDVLSIIEDPDFIAALNSKTIVVDHTTTSFKLVQNATALCAKYQAQFIDAPVSGGEAGAIKGTLTTMLGGDEQAILEITPLIQHYCKSITHIGESGFGQLAKMANQICISGILQGLSEAILFAENENIDIKKLLKAISGGAAQSWQMENRAQSMHNREFDFGFAINWMIKDLGYCLDRAKENNTQLSLTQDVYERYRSLAKQGEQNSDTSVLIKANE